ncbi:uncharacterized protein Dwil_GK25163 [Drosophila willistoni]|uniref:Uncharacterized protein n=1 Tax=Drosophila willistoni TaxID=7260 RepID=B4NC07_DROWI|nr:actin-related protein 8 [Drosophila willistoni]EDW82366.1 uncharacterized protein Dwil_GK25163 [Drosophila willistoni]
MQRSRASSTSSVRAPVTNINIQPQVHQQPLEAPKIIVIHPGSQNLRIGRAADLNPLTLLHAVAYKRKRQKDVVCSASPQPHHDPLLPPLDKLNDQLQVEFEEQRLAVSRILQHCVVDDQNRLRVATPPQQLALFNRNSVAEKIPAPAQASDVEESWQNRNGTALYDEQILQLNATNIQDYDIHFPIQRGELNLHQQPGGSLQATLEHLERIWSHALEYRLKIPLRDLGTHCAVLVVNDVFVRRHLREYMTLLLQRLGFQRCFLVQDSVAATYGAGLGHGCVVDIGAQKTSIACVEDGISQLDARVRLPYGGADVDHVLLMLLRKCGFPYRECNVQDSYVDARVLVDLKERFCHLNVGVCGSQEKHFTLRRPNGQWIRYTLQVGDEAILAPLALFHTELLNITGKTKDVATQQSARLQYDCEDCFDAEFLRETGRKGNNNGMRAMDRDPMLNATGMGQALQRLHQMAPVTADDDELIVVDQDDTITTMSQASINSNSQLPPPIGSHPSPNISVTYHNGQGQIVPLDQAIIQSIGRCASYDTKRKMFGSILLVGSMAKLNGLVPWLEQRIVKQIPPGVDINVFTKSMDVGMVAWKGAAIMSVLESARELWITQQDWQQNGLRILRERSPFLW